MKIKKEIIPDLQEIGRLAFEREVTVGNPQLAREGWEHCALRGTLTVPQGSSGMTCAVPAMMELF